MSSTRDVTEDLTFAVRTGKLDLLQAFLEKGADPNLYNCKGSTALHVAAECGRLECSSILINHRANVNACDAEGQTPLHKAVSSSTVEDSYGTPEERFACRLNIIRFLICCGADQSIMDSSGATAHDLLIQSYSSDFIVEVDRIFSEENIKSRMEQNRRALVKACETGDSSTVEQVLPDFHSSVNEPISARNTLLMIASQNGHALIVQLLIDHGAQPNLDGEMALSALHVACKAGYANVVQTLLNGLPGILSSQDSEKGTALFLAVKHAHQEVVKELLSYAKHACKSVTGDQTNVSAFLQSKCLIGVMATDQEDRTPLHEAASIGHVGIVKLLVDFIKDHAVPMHFEAPLLALSENKLDSPTGPSPQLASTALSRSVTSPLIDAITLKGKTPFHEAAQYGHTGVMEVLLQAGADINSYIRPSIDTTAQADLTALVHASLMNRVDIVKFLLDHGATDARLKALTRSLRHKYNGVVGLLLCYNGGVVVSDDGKKMQASLAALPVKVAWNSKKLPYLCKEWLSLAVTEAPKTGGQMCAITELDISSNELGELPVEVFQLPAMIALDASRNQLITLPEGEWLCSSLQVLDANNNQLKYLPECLFTLPKLKELNVSNNKIADVPMTIWKSKSLAKIFLGRNLLKALPCPLLTISLDNVVPPSHQNGRSVQDVISLARPEVYHGSTLPILAQTRPRTNQGHKSIISWKGVYQINSNLDPEEQSIDESSMTVQDGAEEGAVLPLDQLDLSYNQLTAVPNGLSCLAPKLQKLNISYNSIKSLGCINDYPTELEVLDASGNHLNTAIAPTTTSYDGHLCAAKLLNLEQSMSVQAKTCPHRLHRTLARLGNLKLNHNCLVELQLFRMISRPCGPNANGELTASTEGTIKGQTSTTVDQLVSVPSPSSVPSQDDMFLSLATPRTVSKAVPSVQPDSPMSSPSGGSLEGSNTAPPLSSAVLAPLYPQLNTLEVSHNQLRSVPANLQHVTNLSCLNISYNKDIDTLPLELSNLEHLWSLEYEGLPLTNPPLEDLNKFKLAYDKISYMKSLLHDAKPNESLKLMLVGLQKRGKTTLLSRITEVAEPSLTTTMTTFTQRVTGVENLNTSYGKSLYFFSNKKFKPDPPLSTVGVDLGVWRYRKDLEPDCNRSKKKGSKPLPCVTFYTWDFGGQEEYYVTHQCFLSARSLYLAVWDVTTGAEGIDELGPWLHNIQARAPGSPVVIVGTHCDMLRPEEEKQIKNEYSQLIRQKYLIGRGPQQLRELGLPKIMDILYVGCHPGGRSDGLSDLRKSLYEIAFSLPVPKSTSSGPSSAKAKLLEQRIPASFLRLEERVRQLAVECKGQDQPPVIKEAQFLEATKDVIATQRDLNQAVTFLHENGVMLHYATPALSCLYFLDPQWLCDMLAHIITVPEVFKGDVFPQTHQQEYIELLGKFEVALVLNEERLLVPSMLALKPQYTMYAFPNIFPRPCLRQMLAQIHKFEPSGKNLWSTGLLIRRFYFMTYVPGGFWPRLISRFLSSSIIIATVLTSLGYSKDESHKVAKQLLMQNCFYEYGLHWSYWKTGIELWYREHSLLRVSEILPGGTFAGCKPFPPQFEGPSVATSPIEPHEDATDLTFELNGLWMHVDYNPNRGVEILIKDAVCPAVLLDAGVSSSERVWMSARLLSVVVDSIDNLLEDWYPGLGARDGGRNSDSIPYVNRIIPCPFCANAVVHYAPEVEGGSEIVSCNGQTKNDALLTRLSPLSEEEYLETEPSAPAVTSPRRSLAEIDLADSASEGSSQSQNTNTVLSRATKFGFMIESCILCVRMSKPLVCPAHSQYKLPIRDLAPDLMFADLAEKYILDQQCVDRGEYVNHGSFGDIYHGRVYPLPTSKDDEGREVAIKIDRMDSRKFNVETATKAYIEVRSEVSILHNLVHPNVIEFIGVVLQPLCFILEWAPGGSLSSIFQKYRKQEARIGPLTLQQTALQVASGLSYLHIEHGIVYHDLKSPNVLVFQFPSVQYSLQCVHSDLDDKGAVLVKIADMGISRRLGPGGVMGFKGSPGFMAPEILKYAGTEACTEKVDIFSFGMFMYEMIALHFPFEKQNLMSAQIEKLVVDGVRPQLQLRELNNPILFLDIMRWCWQADFRNRPFASQLVKALGNPSVSRLVDAVPLSNACQVTASCICTLPLSIGTHEEDQEERHYKEVATGDLVEELWLCTYASEDRRSISKITIINFHSKPTISLETIDVCHNRVTSICSVTESMWLGDELGNIYIYDAMERHVKLSRQLSVVHGQAISSIIHLRGQRQVAVTRQDGCVLLFDEGILDTKLPDNVMFDNHVKGTALPVRAVIMAPNELPIFCAIIVSQATSRDNCLLCCGTAFETLLVFSVYQSRLEHCRKLESCLPTNTCAELAVTQVVAMEVDNIPTVWGLIQLNSTLHQWRLDTQIHLRTIATKKFAPGDPSTHMAVMGTQLQLALSSGNLLLLSTTSLSCCLLTGHMGQVYSLNSIGGRVLPKHWFPTIVGRSNALDYYRDVLSDEDIALIMKNMTGKQTRLLVSIGRGFNGLEEGLVGLSDNRQDNLVLLWCVSF